MSQTPQEPGSVQPKAGCGCDDGNGRRFAGPSPQEVYQRMSQHVAELKEYATYFVMARADRLKVSVRQMGIYAALGLMGLIALSAAITTAVVLALVGLALALAALFGSLWAGVLVTGVLVLALLALGTWIGISSMKRSSRTSTVDKYEQRQQWERGQFGRSVEEAAKEHH
jgi:membrane protein implicated in regulation of membrane protease activity